MSAESSRNATRAILREDPCARGFPSCSLCSMLEEAAKVLVKQQHCTCYHGPKVRTVDRSDEQYKGRGHTIFFLDACYFTSTSVGETCVVDQGFVRTAWNDEDCEPFNLEGLDGCFFYRSTGNCGMHQIHGLDMTAGARGPSAVGGGPRK